MKGCLGLKNKNMKKIYYNKLIRDGVAESMKKKGVIFETKKLSKIQFEKALLAKVVEEAGGIQNAKTRKELMHEICDVLAVIESIIKQKKINFFKELRAVWKENIKQKGRFNDRLWLVWSEDNGYRTNEKKGKRKIKR